ELYRLLRGGVLDPLPGLVSLVGGLHDRVAGRPEVIALGAQAGEELHVVLLQAHPALGEALHPVATGGGGADAAGGEQAHESVAAAFLGTDGEALLHQGAEMLEGLVHPVIGGVRAGPQIPAGALLTRVERGPEVLAAGGLLLDEEAGVVDVEPGDDPSEEAVGPV